MFSALLVLVGGKSSANTRAENDEGTAQCSNGKRDPFVFLHPKSTHIQRGGACPRPPSNMRLRLGSLRHTRAGSHKVNLFLSDKIRIKE